MDAANLLRLSSSDVQSSIFLAKTQFLLDSWTLYARSSHQAGLDKGVAQGCIWQRCCLSGYSPMCWVLSKVLFRVLLLRAWFGKGIVKRRAAPKRLPECKIYLSLALVSGPMVV